MVIGPIENYTDGLFGYKAAYESYILIKDIEWSKKLEKYAAFLPQLQKELPVDAKYKKETPGSDADLNAYDVFIMQVIAIWPEKPLPSTCRMTKRYN